MTINIYLNAALSVNKHIKCLVSTILLTLCVNKCKHTHDSVCPMFVRVDLPLCVYSANPAESGECCQCC